MTATTLTLRPGNVEDAEGILALVTSHLDEGHLLPRDIEELRLHAHRFIVCDGLRSARLWSRIGRRPILAAGNSNGDIQMLEFTRGMRLLVLHDDVDREFDYTAGAEKALEQAAKDDWTVVSVRNDWTTVFSD